MKTRQLLYTFNIELFEDEGTYSWGVYLHELINDYCYMCFPSSSTSHNGNGLYYVSLTETGGGTPKVMHKFLQLSTKYDIRKPFPFVQERL